MSEIKDEIASVSTKKKKKCHDWHLGSCPREHEPRISEVISAARVLPHPRMTFCPHSSVDFCKSLADAQHVGVSTGRRADCHERDTSAIDRNSVAKLNFSVERQCRKAPNFNIVITFSRPEQCTRHKEPKKNTWS